MAIKLNEAEGGQFLEIHVTGKLTHQDYQEFVPAFEKRLQQHVKLRVLFKMVDFHGWELGAMWDDFKFDVAHFSDIERLAVVGDRQWEKVLTAFSRPFTRAEVRYFDVSAIDEARDWVGSNG